MHNELIRLKSQNQIISIYAYDDDEFDINIETSRLMDMLNDHGTSEQLDAIEICKQRGWAIYREYDPAHYYANEHGYLLWVDITGNM